MKQKRISIVTPVYNGGKYLEKCITSIIDQNYENYEHIIVDGGSTDNTLDIIRSYEGKYPMRYISEPDRGMYDAIKKGFLMATGEIFAWLNSDDTYMPWAFQVMNYVMNQGVQWGTAINALQNQYGIVYSVCLPLVYKQKHIRTGVFDGMTMRFIQQETTFWTRALWEKIEIDLADYRLAGDFILWKEFAKKEPLYTVKTVIGSFRTTEQQLSSNMGKYYAEARVSIPNRFMLKLRKLWYRFSVLFYQETTGKRYIITLPKHIGETAV